MLIWGRGTGQGSVRMDSLFTRAHVPSPAALRRRISRVPLLGRGAHPESHCPSTRGGNGDSRHSAGASSLLSRQSLSPSHFQRSWMQRLLAQANSPGWHWGGGT